jgi:hypothetical protein
MDTLKTNGNQFIKYRLGGEDINLWTFDELSNKKNILILKRNSCFGVFREIDIQIIIDS